MADWSGITPWGDLWPYEQVADVIERAIRSGEWPPGSRLPSQDRIASEAGVSKHTVSAAIALLRDRGIVATRPRLGTFAAPVDTLPGAGPEPQQQPHP